MTHIQGVDLSPHFLAVAKYRQLENPKYKNIHWCHAMAEKLPYADNSQDLLMMSFVVHELPDEATRAVLKELFRVAAPGATIAITDNNPRSKVIQNLPSPIFTMMKSTEPWSDQYYILDFKAALEEAGFKNIVVGLTSDSITFFILSLVGSDRSTPPNTPRLQMNS